MTDIEALKARHSVRNYLEKPLTQENIRALRDRINLLNDEGNLHMQLVLDEPRAFQSILAYGVFRNVRNYVMVVGRKSPTLDYRAGYYSEKLMLFAQSLGLNTCCVGLTYRKINNTFILNPDEKVVVCISIGYGQPDSFRHHKIKSPSQVSNVSATTPQWFFNGVEAALLAPTAINQQKFYFEFIPGNKVRPSRIKSLAGYTKVDLGIAMCNFEIGAGKHNFQWVDNPLED